MSLCWLSKRSLLSTKQQRNLYSIQLNNRGVMQSIRIMHYALVFYKVVFNNDYLVLTAILWDKVV